MRTEGVSRRGDGLPDVFPWQRWPKEKNLINQSLNFRKTIRKIKIERQGRICPNVKLFLMRTVTQNTAHTRAHT